MSAAKKNASDQAILAGAEPRSVRIVDVEEVPLGYLPGKNVRVRVKAIGDLSIGADC